MIAKLMKYTFLAYHRDYKTLLDILQNAGVVHIIEKGRSPEESLPTELLAKLKRYDNAIRILNRKLASSPEGQSVIEEEPDIKPETILERIEFLNNITEELSQKIFHFRNEAHKIEPWGNYDRASFNNLFKAGWQISLYTCPSKKFREEWNEKYSIEVINSDRGKIYFAVIHKSDEIPDIDAEHEKIGEKPISELYVLIGNASSRLMEIDSVFQSSSASWLKILNKGRIDLINTIDYHSVEAQASVEADGKLIVLNGWVPVDVEPELREAIVNSDFYFFESDPEKDEKVPILLKNNNFSRLFEPISKLFDLPNYKELDLTPYFAPFFMLFFGFCLGDAGYGLIFILAGFLLYKKVPVKFRPFLNLAKYLGLGTIIFGMVSGTFFGMNLIDSGYTITDNSLNQISTYNLPNDMVNELNELKGQTFVTRKGFLSAVENVIGNEALAEHKMAILKSADADISLLKSFRHLMQDSLSMFYMAIIFGGLQIIFGMICKIMNITRQRGFLYSLSTVGWVLLALNLIIFIGGEQFGLIDGEATKPVYYILLGISGVLIFFLNNPAINIFLRVGSGVWETYNIITGVFGDLLSYIRLFALGTSSAILGFVFNDISTQFLSIPYIGWFFFILLLLIGHSINIFMATLGAFIHPMRLTFVEFYKNAGFKGGGKEYKPFRINKE